MDYLKVTSTKKLKEGDDVRATVEGKVTSLKSGTIGIEVTKVKSLVKPKKK